MLVRHLRWYGYLQRNPLCCHHPRYIRSPAGAPTRLREVPPSTSTGAYSGRTNVTPPSRLSICILAHPRHPAEALFPHQRPLPDQMPQDPLVAKGLGLQPRALGRELRRQACPVREGLIGGVSLVVLLHGPQQGQGVLVHLVEHALPSRVGSPRPA